MAADEGDGQADDGDGEPLPPFDALPIGSSYIDWLLGSGRGAVRQLLDDPSSERVRTPVLIAFNGDPADPEAVTLEKIDSGDLDFSVPKTESGEDDLDAIARKKAVWARGFFIPTFFSVFNEITKQLQRPEGPVDLPPAGLIEEMGLVMAFASDKGLKLWREEKAPGGPLRKQIRDIFAGPPLDQFNPDGAATGNPWDTLSEKIGSGFEKVKGEVNCSLKWKPGATPDPVITAVIDDGIAFANARFRVRVHSAFHYLWLQADPAGSDYRRNEIKKMLQASPAAGGVDEEALYRNNEILDFGRPHRHALGYSATHGTPVLDIACGRPLTNPRDLESRFLMAVEVPTEAVKDTSLSRLHPFIFAGLVYLLIRSVNVTLKQHAVPGQKDMKLRPMAVNISFGNTAGPHDGLSPFEIALDVMARRWSEIAAPLRIVLPSGNSHLARGHTRAELGPSKTKEGTIDLPWRVLPDDRTDSAVEIWLPPYGARPQRRTRVKIVPPGASAGTQWLVEGSAATRTLPDAAGRVILELTYRLAEHRNHYTGNVVVRRGVFTVHLAPTESLDVDSSGAPTVPVAPSGLWTIVVERTGGSQPLEINAWIQRDDTPFTFRRLGRQSYFDAECYDRFDDGGRTIETDKAGCLVQRGGNMSAIATGYEPMVVGALTARRIVVNRFEPSRYSAGGPTDTAPPTLLADNPPDRTGPDVSAVADDTAIHRGVMAAGTMGGSARVFWGTSVAAPQVTRRIVEIGETSGLLPDRRKIIVDVMPIGGGSASAPPQRVGAGRIAVKWFYPKRVEP